MRYFRKWNRLTIGSWWVSNRPISYCFYKCIWRNKCINAYSSRAVLNCTPDVSAILNNSSLNVCKISRLIFRRLCDNRAVMMSRYNAFFPLSGQIYGIFLVRRENASTLCSTSNSKEILITATEINFRIRFRPLCLKNLMSFSVSTSLFIFFFFLNLLHVVNRSLKIFYEMMAPDYCCLGYTRRWIVKSSLSRHTRAQSTNLCLQN